MCIQGGSIKRLCVLRHMIALAILSPPGCPVATAPEQWWRYLDERKGISHDTRIS